MSFTAIERGYNEPIDRETVAELLPVVHGAVEEEGMSTPEAIAQFLSDIGQP